MATSTQILNGLQIIERYEPGCDFDATEGKIYCGSMDTVEEMTFEEYKIMIENGWQVDEVFGCWTHYTTIDDNHGLVHRI